jgi:hypothetical protein
MSKITIEEQDDVNVSPTNKRETNAVRWFREHAVNNRAEMKIVCDLTARAAAEQLRLDLNKGNTEVYAAIFHATFMAVLDFIRSKQKHYNNFTVEIFDSINIGYTNNDDEDNEKVGNFMPIMEYIGVNPKLVDDSPPALDDLSRLSIDWKQMNPKKNVECCKEIQENAYKKLNNEYFLDMRTSEAAIPLFCMFLDNVTKLAKLKFQEAEGTGEVSEICINVLGLYDIYYSFDEESNKEIIEYQPDIAFKLALKSDAVASRD